MSDPDRFQDAQAAYDRAVADAAYLREQWVKAKRPAVQSNHNEMAGVHPLLRAMWEAESLANKLRGDLGLTSRTSSRRGPGRPPGATSAPDRVPKLRLKSV